MTTSLEKAIAELDKVRDYNEKRQELAAELATRKLSTAEIDAETADRSERLAAAYTRAAAIEEGGGVLHVALERPFGELRQ